MLHAGQDVCGFLQKELLIEDRVHGLLLGGGLHLPAGEERVRLQAHLHERITQTCTMEHAETYRVSSCTQMSSTMALYIYVTSFLAV